MSPGKHKDPAWLTALEPYTGEHVNRDLRVLTIMSVISTMASALGSLQGVPMTSLWLGKVAGSLESGRYVCPKCGRVSAHPQDVEHQFCVMCGFEEDLHRAGPG